MERIPEKLKEQIFEKVFETAEIAKFSPEQVRSYEDSLKYYRDLKNSLDTAREEGIAEGIEKGIEKEKASIARSMIRKGFSMKEIMEVTLLTKEDIERLK